MRVILLVAVILAAIVLLPLLTVWAISVLWDVQAVYDFWHWLAALVVGGSLFAGTRGKS